MKRILTAALALSFVLGTPAAALAEEAPKPETKEKQKGKKSDKKKEKGEGNGEKKEAGW